MKNKLNAEEKQLSSLVEKEQTERNELAALKESQGTQVKSLSDKLAERAKALAQS